MENATILGPNSSSVEQLYYMAMYCMAIKYNVLGIYEMDATHIKPIVIGHLKFALDERSNGTVRTACQI